MARNLWDGCKLYYSGGNRPKNGVGTCLNRYWHWKIDVQRVLDRLVALKLVIPGMNYNIVSAYAPKQGCTADEKEEFWNQLERIISCIPGRVEVIMAGDLNGHVGTERT